MAFKFNPSNGSGNVMDSYLPLIKKDLEAIVQHRTQQKTASTEFYQKLCPYVSRSMPILFDECIRCDDPLAFKKKIDFMLEKVASIQCGALSCDEASVSVSQWIVDTYIPKHCRA